MYNSFSSEQYSAMQLAISLVKHEVFLVKLRFVLISEISVYKVSVQQ